MKKALAYLVHVFTAAGAWAGLKACCAISADHYREAFLYMFLAVAIDSVDGTFARALDVSRRWPHIDGRKLDDMVDYFTWVVTPIYFMAHAALLPAWLCALPLVCSALGMANTAAKTDDDFFLGFPSLWNVVALYCWAAHLPLETNTWIFAALSPMVLAPIKFVYPSKTRYLRTLTMTTMTLWVGLVVMGLTLSPLWLAVSLLFPIYYVGLSLYLNVEQGRGKS